MYVIQKNAFIRKWMTITKKCLVCKKISTLIGWFLTQQRYESEIKYEWWTLYQLVICEKLLKKNV